jgi:hypothetical protein
MAKATLSTLLSRTDYYLGASNIYGTSDKTTGINGAQLYIAMNYEVRELIKTVALTFASGIADIPSDYLRHIKLFTTDSPKEEWIYVNEEDSDKEVQKTFTIKYDSGSSVEKIHIYPTDITTGKTLRHVLKPTTLSGSGTSEYNEIWTNAIACTAAWEILENDRQGAWPAKKLQAMKLIKTALRHQSTEENQDDNISTIYDTSLILGVSSEFDSN